MPTNNGFNDESMIIFGSGIDFSGFDRDLETLEKGVTKATKNKTIDVEVARQSSKEIQELREQIANLQAAMQKLGDSKISKATFQKKKNEFLARFTDIENKLGGLKNGLKNRNCKSKGWCWKNNNRTLFNRCFYTDWLQNTDHRF